MELTTEQAAIAETSRDTIVRSFSGTGKLTTMAAFIRRNIKQPILIITPCENRKTKLNALLKDEVPAKLRLETPYSLAHRRLGAIGNQTTDKLPDIFTTRFLLSHESSDTIRDLQVIDLVLKNFRYYCNSTNKDVQPGLLAKTLYDEAKLDFFYRHERTILQLTGIFADMMLTGKIPMHVDLYVKKFCQLQPRIDSTFIIVDNAQNISDALLDVICRQKGKKIIFYDEHEFSESTNISPRIHFSAIKFPLLLSRSFTYTEQVAEKIRHILFNKRIIYENFACPELHGSEIGSQSRSRAIISRHNITILNFAIEKFISDRTFKQKLYFQGGLDDYLVANENITIWDALSLYVHNFSWIGNRHLQVIRSINHLEEYAIANENSGCLQLIELVRKYRKGISMLIKDLNRLTVKEDKVNSKTLLLTSVSSSMVIKRDKVQLLDDFIDQRHIREAVRSGRQVDYHWLEREINFKYLAASRAINEVELPEIKTAGSQSKKSANVSSPALHTASGSEMLPYNPDSRRISSPGTFKKWTRQEERLLADLHSKNFSREEIARRLQRTPSAVASRIRKMNENR